MELKFQGHGCRCLGRAAREIQNTEVTHELRLPDGFPDIGRVIASWGQIIIRSKEWRADQVMVSGGVMAWVLYAPEDGGDPRSVDAWIPFQLKWNLSDSDREGPIRVCPLLRFVDSRTVSPRKMMLRVGVAAMGEALYPMEPEVSAPGELPEDIELRRETYPVRLPKEAGEKTFLMDEDLTVQNQPVPEKLLGYTMHPEITDKKIMANKVVFRGNGNLHVIYRCSEGRIHTADFELPFSQYSELDGEYGSESTVDIQTAVTSMELDLGEGGQLRLKCGLLAQYLVDDRELMTLAVDAYSPFRSVEVHTSELILPTTLDERMERIAVQQLLPGAAGEVIDISFLPDFPRQRWNCDGAQLEVPALFQVLYYTPEGMLQGGTARWEGSMTLPAQEGIQINAIPEAIGFPRGAVQTEGMALEVQMQMRLRASTDQGLPMVTGLELGEQREPDPDRPSLILRRGAGDDLWEIAKQSGSTVDAIKKANGMETVSEDERMLLIPIF